ncbi:hypothetical protein R1sor_021728 [Riccia sorocarpa]|uniref:Uncharacterized protein n=1 Tax=Riccia sorocarpa TaxID=122646 RepID=A0ABD3GKU4_9MARC
MSPLVSPRTYDLSGVFDEVDIVAHAGTFLTGRTFYRIRLVKAALVVKGTMVKRGRDTDERSVLVETLRAVCSDTTEHKLLLIDDVPGSLSFEDWASVFSTLRYDQSSFEAISVLCTGMMFCAFCCQIGYVLAESSTLEILWFGDLLDPYYPVDSPSTCDIPSSQPRISDEVVKTISEGLVQSRSLRGLGLSTLMLEREFADVLKSAFTANVQNTSLEWIDLPAHLERLDMVLEALLLSNSYKNLKTTNTSSEMLERFTHLKSLQLSVAWTEEDCKADTDQISFLCRSLQSADSVESISILGSKEILENFYPSFFRCLQHKRRLKGLSLDGILWKGEVFSCLMDLLHVNIYLEEVELLNGEWTAGISVIVQAALRRNREQAACFSTLRDAELPFEEGRAARVFLCGQPHAGTHTNHVKLPKIEVLFLY